MWSALLLGGALAVGQPPGLPELPPPAPPSSQAEPLNLTLTVPPPAKAEAPAATRPAPAPAERGSLMQALQGTWYGAMLDDNRLRASGWADGSFTASTDRGNQLPMGFNYLSNQFLLQQNWVRFERTVDPAATTPTWGFRSDNVLPGSDYRFILARGLLSHQLTADSGNPNLYGIDPVQFYGELYLPQVGGGLDVKLGRFFCQYGVESIDATQNALGSRAYNFIYNPFTHTGLLTTLKLTDAWSVQNGIVTGSDMFIGPEANPTYCGSVKWAPPAGRDSVLFAVIVGKGRYDAVRSFSNPEIFDLVYVHKLSDRLTYSLEGLYSFQTGFPGAGFVNNWGVVQYLTYQFSPRLSGTARLEFFDDVQGQRTGFRGLYSALTTGVTFKPAPYLWLRPEVRYDTNAESRPFEGRANLFTATADVIVRW
jgi:hypothetical protein